MENQIQSGAALLQPRLVRLEVYCASAGCSWAGDYDETTWSLKDELTGQIVECGGEDPRGERCCPRCLLTNLVDTEGWDDDQLPRRAFRLPNKSTRPAGCDLNTATRPSPVGCLDLVRLMICSTHTTCNECPNDLVCGDQGECLAVQRQRSRKLLDQLSVGERFMLMFGRGVVKHDPLRVVWKDESNVQDQP
jgi:hypothetical protein